MQRRGVALIDAIIGGMILAMSLAVLSSVTTRAMSAQTDGEKRMTAAWLADELLAMVVVEGPEEYPRLHDTSGRFAFPFDEYRFDVGIEELGGGLPYRCIARVGWGDAASQAIEVETLVALRLENDEPPPREPLEPVDREERYFADEEEGA